MMRTPLALSVAVVLTAFLMPGCGDTCTDLRETCDLCADQSIKDSCTQTVTDGNQELCSGRAAYFSQECVAEDDPSTTSAAAGTTTGGGAAATTTSMGGSGGTGTTGATGGTGGTGGA